MQRISNDNNKLEIVLNTSADSSNSVRALKAKFKNWKGATPPHVPHLKLENSWSENLDKKLLKRNWILAITNALSVSKFI